MTIHSNSYNCINRKIIIRTREAAKTTFQLLVASKTPTGDAWEMLRPPSDGTLVYKRIFSIDSWVV